MDSASFQKLESEFKASIQTVKAFSQRRNLKPVTFYYWKWRYTMPQKHGFVELSLTNQHRPSPNIHLHMGIATLEIPEQFSKQSLAQILTILRENIPC